MTKTIGTGARAIEEPQGRRHIVPLNDLRRQTASLRSTLDEAIRDVVDSGWYVLGPNVTAFEDEFARYCGVRHCIGVGNGTDALELALRALDCGPGSEVVTVANAGLYATTAIMAVGSTPVLVDIDDVTMTMSPEALARAIKRPTRAVVVTHLYGQLARMEPLIEIAVAHGVPIIEDCAQAHGAERGARKAGSYGAIGCFSFYPTKNLGALGDGGALTTSDQALAERLRSLRQYGWRTKYSAELPFGRNSRLDEIQAAILRAKLPHLDAWNDRRRAIMRRYYDAAGQCLLMVRPSDRDHVGHLCVVRSHDRDRLRLLLQQHGIANECHYPIPDHRQTALVGFVPADLALPVTEAAARQVLTLPCFPEIGDEDVARVCEALDAFRQSVADA